MPIKSNFRSSDFNVLIISINLIKSKIIKNVWPLVHPLSGFDFRVVACILQTHIIINLLELKVRVLSHAKARERKSCCCWFRNFSWCVVKSTWNVSFHLRKTASLEMRNSNIPETLKCLVFILCNFTRKHKLKVFWLLNLNHSQCILKIEHWSNLKLYTEVEMFLLILALKLWNALLFIVTALVAS